MAVTNTQIKVALMKVGSMGGKKTRDTYGNSYMKELSAKGVAARKRNKLRRLVKLSIEQY